MAERKEITVRAIRRAGRGKNDAGRLRRDGLVPLTIYGGEGEPVAAADDSSTATLCDGRMGSQISDVGA